MGDKRYRVGGTRGGQDQFKWDDVKSDVHRENYLGHSLLAPVGRWQRGKDLKWWNKKGSQGDSARVQAEMEKARLKQLDEDLLNEALGLAPRQARTQQSELSTADRKQLLEKGATADRDGADTERVSGLGAGPAKLHEHIPTLTLKERELERLKRERERKEGGLTEASLVEILDYDKEKQDVAAAAEASRARLREEKRSKKLEKREKKRAKKEKKEKKREKKRLKKAKANERAPPAENFNREFRNGGVDNRGGRVEGRDVGGNMDNRKGGSPGYGSSFRGVREERGRGDGGRQISSRGRAASGEGRYRNSRGNGDSRDNESKGDAAGWSRRGPGESGGRRERLPATRSRSRSPPTSRERQNGKRGRWDSRDRHGERNPRRVEDSGAARERDGRNWGGEKRPRRSRSASSSSSSSDSSSSDSSSGGHSATINSRSRDDRGGRRLGASRGFGTSRSGADGGRSRSPGRRMGSGSDRHATVHDRRRRGDGDDGRNWPR